MQIEVVDPIVIELTPALFCVSIFIACMLTAFVCLFVGALLGRTKVVVIEQ